MVHRAAGWNSAAGVWTRGLLQRRPVRLVTVALANKMARIAWALMTRKEVYHAKGRAAAAAKAVARQPGAHGRQRAQARLIRQEALNSVMGKAVVKTVQAIPHTTLRLERAAQIGA